MYKFLKKTKKEMETLVTKQLILYKNNSVLLLLSFFPNKSFDDPF